MGLSVFASGKPDFQSDGELLTLSDLVSPTDFSDCHSEHFPVLSPLKGECVAPLSETIWGLKASNAAGMALRPTDGLIFAPFSGIAAVVPRQDHTIGLRHSSGFELLIHIGLTTYELDNFFRRHVCDGDFVRQGDLLLSYDLSSLLNKGYDPMTAVLCPTASRICQPTSGSVKPGEQLFLVDV